MNPALQKIIRKHYISLKGYVSAGMESDKTAQKIFMNANENPFILQGLEGFNRYPEPQPKALLKAYAELYGVKPENIVATRGADEAILVLTRLFCDERSGGALICPPTFGMYPVGVKGMPARVHEVPLKQNDGTYELDTKNIIKAAKNSFKKIRLIFLCSPNNPTGTSFARDDILKICRQTRGYSAVIVDETYIEFARQESLVDALADHPNLILLRTLSKSYALAGMRMGCLISGDTDFIALIRGKCLDAYPLPLGSIDAALKVMTPDNLKRAAENRALLLAERDRLRAAFKTHALVEHVYPSEGNFLLIRMKRAKDFVSHCAAHNIIIRDFSDKPYTEGCVRISPGFPQDNDKLIAQLNAFKP